MTTVPIDRLATRRAPANHLATARRYAADPDSWPLAPRFDPVQRWYHRLDAGPDAEVWLLTWLPGQGTELHDHGESTGAFVVVSGTLTECTVTAGSSGAAPRFHLRTLPAGEGRAFGTDHIHRITNTASRPAVSLHVYGPALRRMTRYRVDGDRLRPVAVERAGTDW
jgi:hypothetical protein